VCVCVCVCINETDEMSRTRLELQGLDCTNLFVTHTHVLLNEDISLTSIVYI